MLLRLSALVFVAASKAAALAISDPSGEMAALSTRSTYPFNQLVAFGDELSDNGNGSYAHGITGSPANVYGYGTWTNGAVAVSYLADMLGVTLRDLAFGGSNGGGTSGATLNNTYATAEAQVNDGPVPSLYNQIHDNYTAQPHPNIHNALEFIWIGENDLMDKTDWFWEGDPSNSYFASNYSTRVAGEVEFLLKSGAPYVFVANIYPKHLAPVTKKYLCSDGSCVDTFGDIIQQANNALKKSLAQFGKRAIYYDVYSYMINLMNNKDANGLPQPLAYYCDGDASDPNEHWNDCMVDGHANEYYWMNFIQPTTHVHRLIAQDMKAAIDNHFK